MRNTITAILFGIIVGTASFGAGCKDKKKEITCEQVTDRFVELAPADMKKHFTDKAQLVENCKKKTSPDERKCIMAAGDFNAVMACRKKPANKG